MYIRYTSCFVIITSLKSNWTIEALRAFDLIKSEISKCTTMHFLSDTDPIYLHTDESDYGVGAYLFQLVDGQETDKKRP